MAHTSAGNVDNSAPFHQFLGSSNDMIHAPCVYRASSSLSPTVASSTKRQDEDSSFVPEQSGEPSNTEPSAANGDTHMHDVNEMGPLLQKRKMGAQDGQEPVKAQRKEGEPVKWRLEQGEKGYALTEA